MKRTIHITLLAASAMLALAACDQFIGNGGAGDGAVAGSDISVTSTNGPVVAGSTIEVTSLVRSNGSSPASAPRTLTAMGTEDASKLANVTAP
ncbi:MAG: hypothetical protein GVY14_03290 [Spirochaetes bacterium]|jgi:hypothetical protein|nr:hypothetical protein [Spirochaetota bacterium]